MNHVDPHLASRRSDPGRPAEATFLDAARQSIVVEFIAHLRNGSGLMVLLGQPGSGRSTILRQVANEAAAQQVPLLAPLDESDAMSALVDAIDRQSSPAEASMARNRRPAGILIDDAEACPVAVWHKLAGLLRHRPAAAPPAPPIILSLPPEMLHWLRDLALIDPAALDARVRRLDPLPPADVGQYVAQRLGAAGHMPPSYSLPAGVVERIAAATRGLPGPLDAFCGALIGLTRLRGGGWVSMEMIETALAAAAGSAPSVPPGQAKPAETPALRDTPPEVAAVTVPPPISPTAVTAAPAFSPAAAAAAIPPLHAAPPPATPTLDAPASATPFAEEPPVRPPLFPDDTRGGTLFQSSRRRRWPWIAGGAGLAVVALAVAGALYVPASDDTRATVHSQPAAPAMVPSMAERVDSGPTPSPAPPASEAAPPPVPTITRDVVESTTPASPTDTPAVGTEEPPVVFEQVKPISRPAEPPPPSTPTTKVKAAATAAPVDEAAKQPAATKQPTAARSTPASTRTSTSTSTQRRPAAASSAGEDTASEASAADGEDPLTPPRPAHELIEIGDDFRGAGDMAWARKYYEAAQQQGSAKATRALAETYDPRLVNGSDRPDPARARDLYEQAAKKGDGSAVKEREDLDQWLSEGQ